jgi:serine/threonine protein kinase/tetratricopeptide (TPR) repeat protein
MADPELKLRELFSKALECQAAEEQAAFLDQVCQGDAELRARLEELLQAHREAGSFLQEPSAFQPTTVDVPPVQEPPGTVIGPYKLLEQIGEGGMGTVWMAQQTEPVRRLVAVKLIKAGMDSRQVIARFEAERQALALMDHPHIARIHDGGTTSDGRPFFVMELVKGIPLVEYCDQCSLTTRERLDLFLSVCQAVQHAHQKGVIHRDLKPSNVLVAIQDGQPMVKVIDFGVAKAINQRLSEHTLQTGFHQMIGTPLYMSPEQAEMSPLDVDTRADIYALGVLLYELLTATTPFEKERLSKASYDEMRRIIREEEPPRPSARLSTLKDKLTSVAAQRRTEPRHLLRTVKGDLDWMVMKALEKDRNRRYETANGFAMDVRRYLADEPVDACPPSAGYRLRKFARRNRRALTAALAFVLLLVTAVVALTVALVAASRERQEKEAALEAEGKHRRKTQAALDAMSSRIIEGWLSNQPVLLPEHRQFLELALRYYEEFAADTGQREEARAGVAHAHNYVGYIREHLGQSKEAEAAWERSRELYAGLVADFPGVPDYRMSLAETHRHLGTLYRGSAGRAPEAEATLRQGLTIARPLVAEFPGEPDYLRSLATLLNELGVTLKNLSRPREAEEAYREALGFHTKLAAEYPARPDYRHSLANTHGNLGNLLNTTDRRPEAAESLGKAVDIYVQLVAAFPAVPRYRDQLAISRNNLGLVLQAARRYPEAEGVYREALTTRKQLVAEFPSVPVYRRGLAMTLNNLGIVLKNTDRAPEAEDLYGQSLDIHKRLAADFPTNPDHQNEAAAAMANLARLLLARKDLPGARRLLEEGVSYHQAALRANPRHPDYRNAYRLNRWRMAETLLELKEHAAAAAAAEQFLQMAVEPPRDSYTAACLLAGCARLAAQGEGLPAGRQEVATAYGDRALAALRQAIDRGAKETAQMPKDPGLDPLRSREDFRKLLAEWEARRKP